MWLLNRSKQRGFAVLTYVLVSIFLIAAVGATIALSRWGNTTGDKQWAAGLDMAAQANLIRNKLLDCANNQGDNGSGTYHPPYPLGSSAGTVTAVTALVCPYSGQSLLSGTDGIFLPPTPLGFSAWTYVNLTTCSTMPSNLATATCGVHIDLVATSATTAAQWSSSMNTALGKLGTSMAAIATTTNTNDTLRIFITF